MTFPVASPLTLSAEMVTAPLSTMDVSMEKHKKCPTVESAGLLRTPLFPLCHYLRPEDDTELVTVDGMHISLCRLARNRDVVVVTARPGCPHSVSLLASLGDVGLARASAVTSASAELNRHLLTEDATVIIVVIGDESGARRLSNESNLCGRVHFVADALSSVPEALGLHSNQHPSITVVHGDLRTTPVHRSPSVASMRGDNALLSCLVVARARAEVCAIQALRVASTRPVAVEVAHCAMRGPLPLEILAAIFDQLDMRSKVRAGHVCREWRQASRIALRRDVRAHTVAIRRALPGANGQCVPVTPRPGCSVTAGVAVPSFKARWAPQGVAMSPAFRRSADSTESHTVLLYPPATRFACRPIRELRACISSLLALLRCTGAIAAIFDDTRRMHSEGTALAVVGDAQGALSMYSMATACLATLDTLYGEGYTVDAYALVAMELRAALLESSAEAHINIGHASNVAEAVRLCTQCLMINAANKRALFLRGVACAMLGDAPQSAANICAAACSAAALAGCLVVAPSRKTPGTGAQ
eukprot:Opistho-2@54967